MKNQIDWSETVRKFGEKGLFLIKLKIMGANAFIIIYFRKRETYKILLSKKRELCIM